MVKMANLRSLSFCLLVRGTEMTPLFNWFISISYAVCSDFIALINCHRFGLVLIRLFIQRYQPPIWLFALLLPKLYTFHLREYTIHVFLKYWVKSMTSSSSSTFSGKFRILSCRPNCQRFVFLCLWNCQISPYLQLKRKRSIVRRGYEIFQKKYWMKMMSLTLSSTSGTRGLFTHVGGTCTVQTKVGQTTIWEVGI